MDEKDFRKHLADLAHGHHHAEEHDWAEKTVKAASKKTKSAPRASTAKSAATKKKRKRGTSR